MAAPQRKRGLTEETAGHAPDTRDWLRFPIGVRSGGPESSVWCSPVVPARWLMPPAQNPDYATPVTRAPRLHRYTFQEYLALEASSTVRHEFLAGEIYAKAGGTPQHAALAMAVGAALLNQTRGGPCRGHSSELRVRSLATGLTTYPDVTVVCGPYETDPQNKNTIVNPRVLVDVTSESTEEYDRGEKLDSYQRIPSLEAVILVCTTARRFWI